MTAQTILPANTLSSGDLVTNSYRSNIGASPRLSKAFSSNSNSNTTFTVSAWVKRSKLGATQDLISAYRSSDGLQTDVIRFGSADDLEFYAHTTNSSGNADIQTNRLFRDVGAWYHIVVRVDTTQGTDTNRVRIYVNGVQETSFSSANYMNQNGTIIWGVASGIEHTIGAVGTSNYFGGYVAEVVYLDSQSVAPTTFGEFDGDSGIWKPIDVSDLTFGNNSFYLDFENSAELGTDVSGNSHTFTENNIDATDQSTDTCTNNFCTLNPLDPTADVTLTEGNLKAVYGTSGTRDVQVSTFGVSSGKWYWEIKVGGAESPNNATLGITQNSSDNAVVLGGNTNNSWEYRGYDGKVYHNAGDEGGSLDTFTENDIIGVAINLDTLQSGLHKLYFSKNGTFQNGADPTDFTNTTGVYGIDDNVDYFPAISDAGSSATPSFEMNFGSPSHSVSSGNADANGHGNFEYAPPAGFFALCTKNLAEFG